MRTIIYLFAVATAISAIVFFTFTPNIPTATGGQTAGPLENANVVIVVTDTLRADHLPFYGYDKDTAPFLSSIAAKGVVFERTYSGCSSTAPAMASVFTSLRPSEHGVITGHIATTQLVKNHPYITLNKIPDSLQTLGEMFKDAGFKTYGVADNLNISQEMGFWQGFDKHQTLHNKGAEFVTEQVKEWLPEITNSGRYLLYVHFMDPHKPYKQHEPWFVDAQNRKEKLINAYDSEIRYVDEHVKELFSMLPQNSNTLFVFLADHGEEFWDHGGDGHGKSLYSEVIRVPFMIQHSALAPTRIKTPISSIDLLPTLADLLGLNKNDQWRGESARPLLTHDISHGRAIFSELLRREEHPKPAKRSVIKNHEHLIETMEKSGVIEREMYDLAADFKEKNNLSSEQKTVAALVGEFQELDNSTHTPREEVKIAVDDESLEELKSLGYVE